MAPGAVRRTRTDETFVSQYLNGPIARRTEVRLRRSRQVSPALTIESVEQCGICIYAAGPQTGVVLDVSPRTAMCVRNVDVQMCPAVHTMTRS